MIPTGTYHEPFEKRGFNVYICFMVQNSELLQYSIENWQFQPRAPQPTAAQHRAIHEECSIAVSYRGWCCGEDPLCDVFYDDIEFHPGGSMLGLHYAVHKKW